MVIHPRQPISVELSEKISYVLFFITCFPLLCEHAGFSSWSVLQIESLEEGRVVVRGGGGIWRAGSPWWWWEAAGPEATWRKHE